MFGGLRRLRIGLDTDNDPELIKRNLCASLGFRICGNIAKVSGCKVGSTRGIGMWSSSIQGCRREPPEDALVLTFEEFPRRLLQPEEAERE